MNQNSDLDISLTSFSGDADLFISTDPEITFNNYKWHSLLINQIDHILITKNDKNFRLGSYYIGVYALIASSYSLTAHIRESFVSLISGWPQSYSLSASDTLFFQYSSGYLLSELVSCTLLPLDPTFRPDVFVSLSASDIYPNSSEYDYKYTYKDYEDFYPGLYMHFLLEKQNKLYLAVSGNKVFGNFQLQCTGVEDTTILKFNKDTYEKLLSPIQKRVYEINVEEKGFLSVFVVPCEGFQKLEISSNWTISNMQTPDISVTRLTDGKLIANLNNAKGRYYVTVSTSKKSTLFDGSSFELASFYSTKGKIPLIVPGNDGKLNLSNEKNGILISWDTPTFENLEKVNNTKILYHVYKTLIQDFSTACSVMDAKSRGDAVLLASTNETFFVYDEDELIIAVVIAVLPDNLNVFKYIFYDPVKFMPANSNRFNFIFWTLVALVLVIVGVIFYFVQRTRKLKEKLSIELTVARNLPPPGNEKVRLTTN